MTFGWTSATQTSQVLHNCQLCDIVTINNEHQMILERDFAC